MAKKTPRLSIIGLGAINKALDGMLERASGKSRKDGVAVFADRLIKDGRDMAYTGFRVAPFEGEKHVDKVIAKYGRADGKPWEIIASGESVLFIEFGTGILWNTTTAHPLAGKFGYYITSWSEKHSGWLIEPKILYAKIPGTWPHRDPGAAETTWYEGNVASMPMYKTARRMREDIDYTLDEVWFGKS